MYRIKHKLTAEMNVDGANRRNSQLLLFESEENETSENPDSVSLIASPRYKVVREVKIGLIDWEAEIGITP